MKIVKKYMIKSVELVIVVFLSIVNIYSMERSNIAENEVILYQVKEQTGFNRQEVLNEKLLAAAAIGDDKKRLVAYNDKWINERDKKIKNVQKLIALKASVNCQDRLGNTPLMIACRAGHSDVVKMLLEARAHADQLCGTLTPLMSVSYLGYTNVVKSLLAGRASVNIHNKFGWTALSRALFWNRVSVVQELLYAQAEVGWKDSIGNTLLHLAVEQRVDNEIINMLIWMGLRPDVLNSRRKTAFDGMSKARKEGAKKAGKERELSQLACILLAKNPQLLVKKTEVSPEGVQEDVVHERLPAQDVLAVNQHFASLAQEPLVEEKRFLSELVIGLICEYMTVPLSEIDRIRRAREMKK